MLLAHIRQFGRTPSTVKPTLAGAQNGGSCAPTFDQPQSLGVTETLTRRVSFADSARVTLLPSG